MPVEIRREQRGSLIKRTLENIVSPDVMVFFRPGVFNNKYEP